MNPVLRIWLLLSSAWLSWLLYRKRSANTLWVYFSLATYAAMSFTPNQVDWWLHTWLWMEPIRMVLRTCVTISLFNSIPQEKGVIAKISFLFALSFTVLYKLSGIGPTTLIQFMAVRTYWLIFLFIFLLSTLYCLWRTYQKFPSQLATWTLCIFIYTSSAVIDWRITTEKSWNDNTNFWTLCLTVTITLWSLKEYLGE